MKKTEKKSFWPRVSNKLYTAIIQTIKEREFISSEKQSLRYMYFSCRKSDILVIGFQACNDSGARYNYVKTLKHCHVNRLFIKDDFGPNGCGDYYLGCNGTYSVEKAVYELIDHSIEKTSPKQILLIGSSKGGYAALNFGLHYPNAKMIVAAPQYYLGTYLDSDKWRGNLEDILGETVTKENKQKMDLRLKEKIQKMNVGGAEDKKRYTSIIQTRNILMRNILKTC